MSLSTQPYKGARDFYPEDKRRQKYMFATWRQVCERFGYEEVDAPILESLDIYLAKTGEEIVNEQTYVLEDRGGRKVVIRPEMTPTVSRMVAGRRQELAYPLRWYSIPNLWRYERPQRGRLREHWQLNVDIFGVSGIAAEYEMISLVDAAFKAFGASTDMYELRINHRQLSDYILREYLQLTEAEAHKVSKLIDRMHKLERTEFLAKLDEACSPTSRGKGVVEKLLGVLEARQLGELPTELRQHEAAQALQQLQSLLEKSGITNVRYDSTIMRGFDYYTGVVFEAFDTHPDNNRSMLGGGRYDGLVGLFGVQPVPTVGLGWGDVTLLNFLELHHLLPADQAETALYVVLAGEVLQEAQAVIAQLRAGGLNLAVDYSGRKLGDQLKAAAKKNIEQALIIGETELAKGQFTLKNLITGNEQKLTAEDIIQALSQV